MALDPMTTSLQLHGGKKWLPISVAKLEAHLEQLVRSSDALEPSRCRALRKNVAYSLQHLEFLYRCEQDLSVTSVVWTQTAKTFVVVGCSILEALFHFLLLSSGKAATTEWASLRRVVSAPFQLEGRDYRTEVEYFAKLGAPVVEPMTFDAMCKRVEKKDLAKLSSGEFYKHLPYLRSLRNRVHIHDVEGLRDTDWSNFNQKDLRLIKRLLHSFLQSSLFPEKNVAYFYYLSQPEVSLKKHLLTI